MFPLFKKKKDRVAVLHEGWLKAGHYFTRKQRLFADWLNRKAAGLSPVLLTTLIMLVCVGMAAASTYLIVRNVKAASSSGKTHALPHPFNKK